MLLSCAVNNHPISLTSVGIHPPSNSLINTVISAVDSLSPHISPIPHMKKISPVMVIRVSIEAPFFFPPPVPVYCKGVDVDVGLAVVVVFVPPTELPASVKLAQVIRVLFAKWTVMDRFPKKEPRPGRVEG